MTYRAFTIDQVIKGLKTIPIEFGQADFNGLCNAKCWYCPVKYEGNPSEFKHNTSLHYIEVMLANIRRSKLLKPGFDFIYTCHYNEILLHPEFEEILKLFRKYGFKTMILSNGTPLIPSKVNIILNYSDVVVGTALNIPDIDKEKWSKKAGFSETVYNTLIRNLSYINDNYPAATIQINTAKSGITEFGVLGTDEENARIVGTFRQKFPNLKIAVLDWLSDRAGRLTEHKVLIDKKFNKGRIISGCNHSGSEGGRIYSWFHLNPKGDLFICCDDYDMKYKFGNLLEKEFDDIWVSDLHAEVILKARSEICVNCFAAV